MAITGHEMKVMPVCSNEVHVTKKIKRKHGG